MFLTRVLRSDSSAAFFGKRRTWKYHHPFECPGEFDFGAFDVPFSRQRGYEAVSANWTWQPFSSTGRGGAGNIRVPAQDQFDADTITLVSTRSSDTPDARSPSQTSPTRNMLSTGRGGIGNIKRNTGGDSNGSQTTGTGEGSNGQQA
ncbi:hypothetical protein GYMLUDRAFT_99069 [Collybiopsis luxurians FD-317 M1]|uniref:Uncharacterized protein n=1 Tax=Collybiopsis luxurians FD-317 M1 TaxID=944289 RepID=A0A0D0B0K2_9AGAR|nr:hypothetical protein GYMLUDRAFT_99069 [Collybiopsis luxurians FD-317 M1]